MPSKEEVTTMDNSNDDSDMEAALGITSSLIAVSILVGNLVLIATILFNRELRKSQFSIMVMLLCFISVVIGVIILPFAIDQELKNEWIYGLVWCEAWSIMYVFLYTIAILYLAMIDIERLILALRPVEYKADVRVTMLLVMIGLPWLLAAIIDIPLMMKSHPNLNPGGNCSPLYGSYVFTTIIIFFIVPMVTITLLTILMVYAISRLSRQMYTIQVVSMARSDAIVLCVVNLAFLTLWVPFFIIASVLSFGDPTPHEQVDVILGLKWSFWLGCTSFAIVPWLWFLQRDIRNGYKKMLGCER